MKAFLLLVLLVTPVQAQNDHFVDANKLVDSLREQLAIAQAEARRADADARSFAYLASLPHYTEQVKQIQKPSGFSLFMQGGFEGRAHIDAGVFSGFGAEYKEGIVGIECVARYEYSAPEALTSVPDSFRVKAAWHPAFQGSLKFFLN